MFAQYALNAHRRRRRLLLSHASSAHLRPRLFGLIQADREDGLGGMWRCCGRVEEEPLYAGFDGPAPSFRAFVIGGAFFAQPLPAAGAFTRGSVIFTPLLVTCLDAFSEISMQMLGRPILKKQTSYSMYRPAAVSFGNLLADIPFSATRIVIFNIIVYFMTNLTRSAGGFFTLRLLNYVIRRSDHSLSAQYGGYMIPVDSMQQCLFWIYYISHTGCMENEFMRIQMTFNGAYVVYHSGPGFSTYTDELGPTQACTIFGASDGSVSITGEAYINAGFSLNASDLGKKCFVMLCVFAVAFQLMQIIALDFFPIRSRLLQQYNKELNVSVYARGSDETEKLNQRLKEHRAASAKANEKAKARAMEVKPEHHDAEQADTRSEMTVTDIPAGAEKTTCLDILAQRKNIGVISGDILLDGRPVTSDFAGGTAYVRNRWTCTKAQRLCARRCAFPRTCASRMSKDAYVEEMIELLELQDMSEALVLSLNVEARKWLTIGVELASKPELLLFLEKPTSDLDAQSAWNLVRFLRKLVDQGQAILYTIHQTSSLLFESFDRLLLLGTMCPSNVNPAEYMLQAIGAGNDRVGQLISEIPYNIMCALVYWVLTVYPAGFRQGGSGTNGTSFQLLVIIFFVAVLFNPPITLILGVFCGVTIPYPTLIKFWRSWIYYLNPYTWGVVH
ncbi:hypothetical protein BDZ89DRAFT_1142302 [Hymenopellis radicata]|nr:hypothetical protein BDZ89DRAFT_1142302 [Hymenopellis radicata]